MKPAARKEIPFADHAENQRLRNYSLALT